jgi:hypothetical protein
MKAWEAKELIVTYHQITVYQKGENPPAINWTSEAIKKGYAVSDGAISFKAPVNAKAIIDVTLNFPGEVFHSERHITVPFELKQNGICIHCGTSKQLEYDLSPGSYILTCYMITQDDQQIKYLFDFQSVHVQNSAI